MSWTSQMTILDTYINQAWNTGIIIRRPMSTDQYTIDDAGNVLKIALNFPGYSPNPRTISDELIGLTNLKQFTVINYGLSGDIPNIFSRLSNLTKLELGNNCLSITSSVANSLMEFKNNGNTLNIDRNCIDKDLYPNLVEHNNCRCTNCPNLCNCCTPEQCKYEDFDQCNTDSCNGSPNKIPCDMINIYDNCLDKGGCKGTSYGKTVYFESKGQWEGEIIEQLQAKCIPEGGLHLSTTALADKDHYYGFLHYFDSENCNNRCKGTVYPTFTGVDKKWVIQFRDKGDYVIRNIGQNPSSNPKGYQLKICENDDSCKIIDLPINLPSTSKGDPSVVYKGDTNIETYIYIQYAKGDCTYKASTCNSSLCPPSLNLGDSLEESPTETKKTPKYRMCYNSRTGCFQIVH